MIARDVPQNTVLVGCSSCLAGTQPRARTDGRGATSSIRTARSHEGNSTRPIVYPTASGVLRFGVVGASAEADGQGASRAWPPTARWLSQPLSCA